MIDRCLLKRETCYFTIQLAHLKSINLEVLRKVMPFDFLLFFEFWLLIPFLSNKHLSLNLSNNHRLMMKKYDILMTEGQNLS